MSNASHRLADEVKKKVRERGIVMWLDAEHHYGAFVDTLNAREFPYKVLALRGSYLELMLAMRDFGNALEPEHLLVHLPGLNKDSVKETPLYELTAAGTVFEKNLTTLVREASVGGAKPEDVDAFMRSAGLTLEKADAWLDELGTKADDGIRELTKRLELEDTVMDILSGGKRVAKYLPAEGDALLDVLEKGLGLSAAWRKFRIGDAELRPEAFQTLVASWLMAVEFVHDLSEPAVTLELRALEKLGPFAKESRRLAAEFREALPTEYEELANDLSSLIDQERTSHHASALGTIDTFRFEESSTRAATIDAIRNGAWDEAEKYAALRTPDKCFWVKRSTTLQRTWELLRLAADAGRKFASTANALDRCMSVDDAMKRYAEKLAPVDRAHRHFEQRAHASLAPDLEDYDALLEVRTAVRVAHRAWTNGVNRAFYELCVAHGPLPERALRQRAIFEDAVQPDVERGGRIALFLVDALRFEMAQGLADDLKREKYQVNLTPRLSELPSETSVGMNALAPVAEGGRLRAVVKGDKIDGFRSREFSVCDPAARVRAIFERSIGPAAGAGVDLVLETFRDLSLTQLERKLQKAPRLVVIRSTELDEAGENNLHLGTWDGTLGLLKTAISLLSQAGVERFVVTADHGFLMQDATTANVEFGASKRVPKRRHALLDAPSGRADVLEVKLSALDYDVEKEMYLVFAPDTAVWKTRDHVAPFVHGGNSLQERVIPVLQFERAAPRGKTMCKYEVVASAEPARLGRQRILLAVRLQQDANAMLGFVAPKAVSLALRVPKRNDLTITLLEVGPPGTMAEGRVMIPPNRDQILVEFEVVGAIEEKVLIEVFHPDAIEDVKSKTVEAVFDVGSTRRARQPSALPPEPPTTETAKNKRRTPSPMPAVAIPATPPWAELVEDKAYRQVLQIIEERRSINEQELQQILGSAMRVRIFARNFDKLVALLPFEVEVMTVNGMKAYARKD